MQYGGFILISIYAIYVLLRSIDNVLIGCGKKQNPMYETSEKKKYVLRKGIIGLVGAILGGGFFITIFILGIL